MSVSSWYTKLLRKPVEKRKHLFSVKESLQHHSLLFFQWNKLSSYDITDAIAASPLTSLGAAIIFQMKSSLSLFVTPKSRPSLSVVPHRTLSGPDRCGFSRKSG